MGAVDDSVEKIQQLVNGIAPEIIVDWSTAVDGLQQPNQTRKGKVKDIVDNVAVRYLETFI